MADMRLKVVASSIDGKGIAKLDSDSCRSLKLGDGQQIIVTYGAKSLELFAKPDTVFSPATIRLMKVDMNTLRVETGMEVTIAKKNGSVPAEKPAKAPKGKGKKKSKANAASLDRF
jgi:hypothetical protein